MNDNDEKLFGKYNELILLFIGFLLTTILGSLIGSYFQNESYKLQNKQKVFNLKRQTSVEIFENISSIMDKRLYTMRIWFWAIVYEKDDLIIKRLNMYRNVLFEWNSNLNRSLALISIYFGEDFKQEFYNSIHSDFLEIGNMLEDLYNKFLRKELINNDIRDNIQNRLDNLNAKIYRLNIKMLKFIKAYDKEELDK